MTAYAWALARVLTPLALVLGACSADQSPASDTTATGASTAPPTVGAYGGVTTNGNSSTSGATTAAGSATTGLAGACSTGSGRDYFMSETGCARCHGSDALGIAELGPEVRNPAPDYARWIIRNGRQGHPEFLAGMEGYDSCQVTEGMLEEILVVLASFGKAADGAGLYLDFCANCHGTSGQGGVTGVDLNGKLREFEEIVASGNLTTEYENRSGYMPVMTDRLSTAELDLILEYLKGGLGLAE